MFNNIKKEIEKDFNIRDNYKTILSKANKKSRLNYSFFIVPILATIIVAIGIGKSIQTDNDIIEKAKKGNWKVKEVYANATSLSADYITDEASTTSKALQFNVVEYNNIKYENRYTKLPSEVVDKYLENGVVKEITNDASKQNAQIYSIKNISTECGIAVKLQDSNEYYIYLNYNYNPNTLGQFINDLNLKELISFEELYFNYLYTDEDGNKEYKKIEFSDVDENIIWDKLLNDKNIKNEHNLSHKHISMISINASIPLLGYKETDISISEDGYIFTSILEMGKCFYIGEKKANEFLEYIIKNYEGYEIVYIDDNVQESKEDDNFSVVVYDNSTNSSKNLTVQPSETNYTLPYTP